MGKEPRTPVPPSVCTEQCLGYIAIRGQSCTFRCNSIYTLIAARGELSPQSADKPCPGNRNTEPLQGFGRAPHIPLWSDTTMPKGDPIWAKMYCTRVFYRQMFSEHHHKSSDVRPAFSITEGKFRVRGPSKPLTIQYIYVICT